MGRGIFLAASELMEKSAAMEDFCEMGLCRTLPPHGGSYGREALMAEEATEERVEDPLYWESSIKRNGRLTAAATWGMDRKVGRGVSPSHKRGSPGRFALPWAFAHRDHGPTS